MKIVANNADEWRDIASESFVPLSIQQSARDFNASLDNVAGLGPAPMGNCGDAALKMGAGAAGTWPSSLPTLLGTQIDHVFYSSEWVATAFSVLTSQPSSASDHRPITATLVPVAN